MTERKTVRLKFDVDDSYAKRDTAKMVENVPFTYLDPSGNAIMFGTGLLKMRRRHNDCGRRSLGCCKIHDLRVK